MIADVIETLPQIVIRFGIYLGFLGAAGTIFSSAIFKYSCDHNHAQRYAILAAVACFVDFALTASFLSGSISGALNPAILKLIISTPIGEVSILRFGVLAGLVLLLGLRPRSLVPLVILSALGLWSFTLTGHIAQSGSIGLRLFLFLHLVAIAIWIGVLHPLHTRLKQPNTHARAGDLALHFGRLAAWLVPLLLALGIGMAIQLLGSIAAIWSTGYGQTLCAKLICVAALLGLAAANKLRLTPALRKGSPAAANHLSITIRIEWVFFVLILLTTAALTTGPTVPTY